MATRGADPPSLLFRAVLAVVLTVAFYLLSLAVALLLFAFAWFMLSEGRLQVQALLFCLVGGTLILVAIFPRPDRFAAPGPRLLEEDHPRLFAELRRIAASVEQGMPEEVYLVPDLNAGVLQRGGTLGWGGRRVMVLGLPLLAVLTVSEFRAVLAHEFGHYHGGETRIGPWIYRTQEAIGRTVRSLSEAGTWLRFLFIWYGNAFLRITLAISRRQEFAADRLAAGTGSAAALADGLRRVHGAGPLYDAYVGQELVPALAGGIRPPLAEGFARFLRAENVAKASETIVQSLLGEAKGDPYDSHPPLPDRIAALGDPEPVPPGRGDPRAATLLEDLDGMERLLLASMFPKAKIPAGSTPWREAGLRVYAPLWRKQVAEERPLLAGVTPATLPAALAGNAAAGRWKKKAGAAKPAEGPPKTAVVAATAMLLALLDRGWTLRCEPGEEPSVHGGEGIAFLPYREAAALAAGETGAEAWAERVRALGIADVDLAAVAQEGGVSR